MAIRQIKSTIRIIDARAVKAKAKVKEKFYESTPWRSFIAALIKKRGRRCEECGRTGTRIYGDHVIELNDGGAPLDEENILLRCGSCHTKKTLRVRGERMAEKF